MHWRGRLYSPWCVAVLLLNGLTLSTPLPRAKLGRAAARHHRAKPTQQPLRARQAAASLGQIGDELDHRLWLWYAKYLALGHESAQLAGVVLGATLLRFGGHFAASYIFFIPSRALATLHADATDGALAPLTPHARRGDEAVAALAANLLACAASGSPLAAQATMGWYAGRSLARKLCPELAAAPASRRQRRSRRSAPSTPLGARWRRRGARAVHAGCVVAATAAARAVSTFCLSYLGAGLLLDSGQRLVQLLYYKHCSTCFTSAAASKAAHAASAGAGPRRAARPSDAPAAAPAPPPSSFRGAVYATPRIALALALCGCSAQRVAWLRYGAPPPPGSLPRALRLVLAPALRFESRVGFILESAAQGEAIRALRTGGG